MLAINSSWNAQQRIILCKHLWTTLRVSIFWVPLWVSIGCWRFPISVFFNHPPHHHHNEKHIVECNKREEKEREVEISAGIIEGYLKVASTFQFFMLR